MTETSIRAAFGWPHALVLAAGLGVFIALFFAEHTPPLENRAARDVAKPETEMPSGPPAAGVLTFAALAPPDGDTLRSAMTELNAARSAVDSMAALKQLGDAAMRAGRPDLAAVARDMFYQADPKPERLKETAEACSAASDFFQMDDSEPAKRLLQQFNKKAIGYYGQYVAAHPDDVDAQVELAVLRVHSEEPMQGILALRGLAEKHPKHFRAQLELGLFSMQTQQIDKALERFQAARTAAPDKWEPCFYLGLAYEQQQKLAEARKSYEEAMARLNDSPQFRPMVEQRLKALTPP